ncbi:EamA family transporter [Mycolicibacterium aubagnense]
MTASNGTNAGHFRTGMIFAVLSAFTFGMAGALGKSLIEAGWSPTAAVVARLTGGALVMAVVATVLRRGWVREALSHKGTVIAYGAIPITGAQLCYFNAVTYLPVGIALLLEYAAPLLVVGWVWATTRRRPSTLTLAGVAIAVAGITLVLGLIGPGSRSGAPISAAGIAWGMGAAVCAACYFVMSDKASADGTGLHSITLATGGLMVGAATVALLGVSGVMPLAFTSHDTTLAGLTTSWLVPVIALAIVPTAMAYTFGIMGIARLQPPVRLPGRPVRGDVRRAVRLGTAGRGDHRNPIAGRCGGAGRAGACPAGRPRRSDLARRLAGQPGGFAAGQTIGRS